MNPTRNNSIIIMQLSTQYDTTIASTAYCILLHNNGIAKEAANNAQAQPMLFLLPPNVYYVMSI